jgi:rhodanese-related sulfurtransferase
VRHSLLEGILVAAVGAALAFAANSLSPRGLVLNKNFFPGGEAAPSAAGSSARSTNGAAPATNSAIELLSAKLRADGLQLADTSLARQFFHDPRRSQDGVIFIDARDDEHYQAGHIPGAYHFNHFHPENYLSNVVQVCLIAQQIVFYCNGGDCEDSEHAAITLRDSLVIPREKVFVYVGGMADWTTNGLPVEIGARNSGQFTNVAPSAAAAGAGGTNR